MKRMLTWLAVLVLGSGILGAQSVNLKVGLFIPRLDSDLWQINMENLTFDKANMVSTYYAGEYEFELNRHATFSVELGSYTRTIYAQYRDYTWDNGAPIDQAFSLRLTPIEANLKYFPMGSRYRIFPFIGVGLTLAAWTYQQSGFFINFEDMSIREGFAETRRFSFGGNARLGLVFRFHPRLALALEGKYQYLKGRLSDYFQGFEPLDLGGFTANVSINVYFK